MASLDVSEPEVQTAGDRLALLLAAAEDAPTPAEGLRACLKTAVEVYGWRAGLLYAIGRESHWVVNPAEDVVAARDDERLVLRRWAEVAGMQPRQEAPGLPGVAADMGLTRDAAIAVAAEGEAMYFLQFLADAGFGPAADFDQTLRRVAAVIGLRIGLDRSTQRFGDLADWLTGHYWETDENHCFSRLDGVGNIDPEIIRGQLLGRTRLEFAEADAENDPKWRQHRADLMAHRPFSGFEYENNFTGGRRVWRVSGRPVFDSRGVFRGYRGVAADITAQRQAEDRLVESEDRFKRFAEITSDWLWEMDADLRYTWVSPKLEEILGIPVRDAVGKHRGDVVRTDLDPEGWKRHLAAIERREPYRDFISGRDSPKGLRWVRSAGMPVFDEQGAFKGYFGTGVDITDLLAADQEANRARELLHQAVNSLSQLFALWDADDRLVLCNESFHRINTSISEASKLGVTFAEHLQACLDAGLVPEAKGREESWFRERVARHRNPGPPIEVERGDGRWMLLSEQRTTDGGTILIGTDITEQKQAEIVLRDARDDLEQRVAERTVALREANSALRQEIAERIRVGAALRDSEERFRDYAASSADWFWEMDAELRFTYMSPNVERIVGARPEWHYGKTRQDLFGEGPLDDGWVEHLATLERHEPFREFVYLRKGDGKNVGPRWVSTSGVPRFDVQGRFLGYRGTGREVTSAIEAQRLLRESEERFRDYAASSADWFWELDEELHYVYISENVERIVGLTPEWHYGKTRDEIRGREHVDDNWRAHLEMLRRHAPFRDFVYLRPGDGEVPSRWLSSSGVPRFDAGGRFLGYRGTGREVTATIEAQRRLRESEALLRLITDNLPVMVAYIDADERFVFINKVVEVWLNRSASSLIGNTVRQVMGDQVYREIQGHIRRALAGKLVHYDNHVDYPDGVTRNVQVVYVPDVGQDGRVRGYIVLVVDVSEQRASEAQLRQAQKMEAVGQLTGGIAHDFNNLLTVVLGSLDLLGLEVDEASETGGFLAEARRAVEHGSLLTQQLLAFARRQALTPRPTDVNALVGGFAPILQHTLGEHIQVQTQLDEALWQATVDRAQLENVLLNLALNARDAMPAGGPITITTANVSIDEEDAASFEEVLPGPYVVLSFADAGTGMSEEVLAHVVEPFFTTKEVGMGSGLGLSMVFGFVKQSQGHLVIDSAPGAGTTVRLYLPRAGAAETEAVPLAGEAVS